MKTSEIINRIMFDYESMSAEEIETLAEKLPRKLKRWIAINHPDNRTRLPFYRMTNVTIGKDTVVNQYMVVSDDYEPLVQLGDRVAVSPNVSIIAASAPNNSRLNDIPEVKERLVCQRPVVVEDDVWIGTGAILLPGVTVGARSIIAAGAVVSKDIPPDSVAAGAPARVTRRIGTYEYAS